MVNQIAIWFLITGCDRVTNEDSRKEQQIFDEFSLGLLEIRSDLKSKYDLPSLNYNIGDSLIIQSDILLLNELDNEEVSLGSGINLKSGDLVYVSDISTDMILVKFKREQNVHTGYLLKERLFEMTYGPMSNRNRELYHSEFEERKREVIKKLLDKFGISETEFHEIVQEIYYNKTGKKDLIY